MRKAMIEAGQIVTTHGVRGELKVLPWMDGPDMLLDQTRCRIGRKEYAITSVRVQKTCCLVKLDEINSVEAAQLLRGKTMELYREDLPEELIFASELYGVEVYADGEKIGVIEDVLDYPGNSVYVVRGVHEYMIPAVKQFILSTDLESNTMQVQLLEGMRSDED